MDLVSGGRLVLIGGGDDQTVELSVAQEGRKRILQRVNEKFIYEF